MAQQGANGANKSSLSPPRVRAYREFLTPLLHRRFVSAAFLATGICYAEALALSFQSSSFTWLPITALMRASLLFVPALIIFLLRISQLRFGVRLSASPFQAGISLVTEGASYQVAAFYFFAAWVFSEVHIHSAPYEADLGWVANGELYERLRLNEKVIYLRSHAFIVAAVQTLLHLINDYSSIRLPVSPMRLGDSKSQNEPLTIKERLRALLPALLGQIFNMSLVLTVLSPFVYIFVRPWAWRWSLSFARLIWNIPENSQPGMVPPFHWSILLRTLVQGVMLFGLSEGCNTLFTTFVAQEPTKYGKPLTTGSKDPNGSLINGLQSRKLAVRSYALWELDIIVKRFEDRRKSILTEIDRKGQSAWEQVLKVCLETINGMNTRIAGPEKTTEQSNAGSGGNIPSLPKIASPMRKDAVAEAYRPKDSVDRFASYVELQAKRAGEAPPNAQLDLSPRVKKFVNEARDKFLTKEQQQALSKEQVEASTHSIISRLLRFKIPATPFTQEFQPGVLFWQTFARRVKVVLFGTPFSMKTNIIRASDILSDLLVASVTEDTYGVVSRNVPDIWRSFVKAIDGIDTLMKTTAIHWTDVQFNDRMKSDGEIEEVRHHLRLGLATLVETFSNDASARGLTPADIKDAKRVTLAIDRKA